VSKVHSRSPEGLPMGHLNINISGVNSAQAQQIQALL